MGDQCISAEALAILREVECDANRTRITSGQLARPLYEEVNEVLVRLGGKWKGGRTRAHLFPYDPRPLLAGVIATGEMPLKNPFAFFPTPSHLVDLVMESPLFKTIQDGDSVLEPSAGFGAVVEGMRTRLTDRQVQIDCCEIVPINQQVLRSKGLEVVCDDFLTYQPEKRYRAIVMNPPFAVEKDRLAYITHIRHAWELLEEDGFLIAFAPSGYTFRSDKKSYDFLSFVLTYGCWEELPPKSFHESGTDSTITLITLEKRDQSWRYQPYSGCPTWFCWNTALLADNGDDAYHAQNRFIAQLNRGELCANPRLPAWSKTQAVIREYYHQVIAKARKNDQQHLDIRPQDWPFLEQNFMMNWDDTWRAENFQEELSVPLEASAVAHMEAPAPSNHAASPGEPIRAAEVEEPVPFSSRTPLYSPVSYDASFSPEQLSMNIENTGPHARDSYSALPWCLETLVGTTWRKIHTGEMQTVHHLATNHFGKLTLCGAPTKGPGGQDPEIIGFWSGERYIVEHWVRVDQQSEEGQLHWFGVELAWLRRQITLSEHEISAHRSDTTNCNLHKRTKKGYQRRLYAAEASLRDFAGHHHLSIPFEVLNTGMSGSERAPVQMTLL